MDVQHTVSLNEVGGMYMEIWFMFSMFWSLGIVITFAIVYFISELGLCWTSLFSTVILGNLALISFAAPFVIV